MDKTTRQLEGALKWRDAGGRGMWVFPTGFGKTLGTIRQILLPMLQKRPYKVIILVHRIKLCEQWNQRLESELNASLLATVSVQTVQWYVVNSATEECDLLVVDEIHKFYAEEYHKYIDGTRIKFKYCLGLTATPYDSRKRHEPILKVYPIVDTITQSEAIEHGWISKFIEFNIPVELNESERATYDEAVATIGEMEAKFDPEGKGKRAIERAKLMLYGGKDANGKAYTSTAWAIMFARYNGWSEELEVTNEIAAAWNPKAIIGYAAKLMKAYKEKDNVLNHCAAKYTLAIKLLRKFRVKTMCFSESTYFADKLATVYNKQFRDDRCVVFHSQLPSMPMKDENGNYYVYASGKKKGERKKFGIDSIKKYVIDLFVNNKQNTRILSTARILDEGFDCEDIRMGIITSRSSNHNQQIQRGGRIKRVIPDKVDDVMLIVNIYVLNTDDARKLFFAQRQYTHAVKYVSDIDEIEFDGVSDDEIADL